MQEGFFCSMACEMYLNFPQLRSIPLQILGIIDQPVLGERWIGISGRKTTLNGQEVATRDCEKLAHAYLYVSPKSTLFI